MIINDKHLKRRTLDVAGDINALPKFTASQSNSAKIA